MKPEHYKETNPAACINCEHCFHPWYRGPAWKGETEHFCRKHDFLIGHFDETEWHVCDDFELYEKQP